MYEYFGSLKSKDIETCDVCGCAIMPGYGSRYGLKCRSGNYHKMKVCKRCEGVLDARNREEAWRNSPEYKEQMRRWQEKRQDSLMDDYYRSQAYEREVETLGHF